MSPEYFLLLLRLDRHNRLAGMGASFVKTLVLSASHLIATID
jgi:hypothetical protein